MSPMLLDLAAEETRDVGPTVLYGIGTFALLCALLFVLLVFGKGRPHS
jgi:hypothetical protein